MKRTYQLTTAALIALAFVGVTRHAAQADNTEAPSTDASTISTLVTGGPSAKQQTELSEHGLAAAQDIRLARLAINDGYVDSAKKLLAESRTLLDQVRKEDRPVTVTTDVKTGDKKVEHTRNKERLDLIPIFSELEVMEGFEVPDDGATANETPATAETSADAKQAASSSQPSPERNGAQTQARDKAISEAKAQLRQGDRQAAAKALELADLTLITRVVSLPLEETSQGVDKAIEMLDQGKLHEANMALKRIQDSLVMTTAAVAEPVAQTVSSNAAATQANAQTAQTDSAKTKTN
ncbi:YfdX family protein [Imhoffiella purpurea]|uniref:YfdX protein n=1 Tax=Imhoffiella purpurea TaxID=1249627 RepID=W9VAF6_9GAMM|nr:YfdX family protein [Imhoffiella purpurea]EXJ16414.1 hypothetical protein D779_0348 [Imhoffiella purpurea]